MERSFMGVIQSWLCEWEKEVDDTKDNGFYRNWLIFLGFCVIYN